MASSKTLAMKVVELALAVIIYWLHYETYEAEQLLHQFIIMTAFAGFLIVVIGSLIAYLTGGSNAKHSDFFYCIAGGILYIVAGALSIHHFRKWRFSSSTTNLGLAKGAMAIIQGFVFFADIFFVYSG
ncbi:uncharacterized protein LOC106663480 [Cimex lectularius]|uniref:DUF7775 domain-containing protein n=1 Tax=Cimex lectularius TaxID=79782 RepID=A0A8I6RD24_CIMLE|nr:uncharacterized protein LOC106663480 [Cimex lectularius]XP_024082848.1 uncharacterized protein LOC106663480 [Cimex lectularius]